MVQRDLFQERYLTTKKPLAKKFKYTKVNDVPDTGVIGVLIVMRPLCSLILNLYP